MIVLHVCTANEARYDGDKEVTGEDNIPRGGVKLIRYRIDSELRL